MTSVVTVTQMIIFEEANGGYIFRSFTTNGGEVTLQIQEPITKAEYNTAIYGTPDPETTGSLVKMH